MIIYGKGVPESTINGGEWSIVRVEMCFSASLALLLNSIESILSCK